MNLKLNCAAVVFLTVLFHTPIFGMEKKNQFKKDALDFALGFCNGTKKLLEKGYDPVDIGKACWKVANDYYNEKSLKKVFLKYQEINHKENKSTCEEYIKKIVNKLKGKKSYYELVTIPDPVIKTPCRVTRSTDSKIIMISPLKNKLSITKTSYLEMHLKSAILGENFHQLTSVKLNYKNI